jgi:UDP-3-O-[3-hydroxymyristoyl] glucosamine N-acyltransferase
VHFVNRFSGFKESSEETSISSTARIHKSASIGSDCQIGDYVTIGPNCVIEDNVTIDQNVTLVRNCVIGRRTVIQPGAILGADGFAYERRRDGALERFPHFGRVIIGKNVRISSNCSIARGSLADTIIGDGTKLDALVHIAHNATVGKRSQLTAGTIVGGSTNIGDLVWAGLNCTIKDHLTIGNNALIASGASVIKSVPEGDVVAGVPAKSIRAKVNPRNLYNMIGRDKV